MVRWIILFIIAVPLGLYLQTEHDVPFWFVVFIWVIASIVTGIWSMPKTKGPEEKIPRKGREDNDIDHLLGP